MNRIVKRGFSAYKIVLRNKLATSIMMLMGGVMMTIGGIQGKGNDTKTMPSAIFAAGAIFTCWAFYRIGFIKASTDKAKGEERAEARKALWLQIGETALYLAIAGLGLFLLLNDGFMNIVLNLMTGGFSILNGVFGGIWLYKNRENHRTFFWRFRLGLTILECVLGPYFIFASNSITPVGFTIMGIITSIAGVIEVFSALTREELEKTMKDGKEIIKTIKEDDPPKKEKAEPKKLDKGEDADEEDEDE
jgi:uncharacterized membrane protein HdeD (DUF308 family)